MLCPTCNRAVCAGHLSAAEVAEMRRKEQEKLDAERVKAEEAERLEEEERRAPVIQKGEESLDAYERGMLRLLIEREEEKQAQFRLQEKMVRLSAQLGRR